MQERVIYSSFNYYSLKKLRDYEPEAQIGLLMGEGFVRVPDDLEKLKACSVHPWERIVTREYVEKCHMHGIKVHTWTVDNFARMRQVIEMGVDTFITNCPDNGRRIADEM